MTKSVSNYIHKSEHQSGFWRWLSKGLALLSLLNLLLVLFDLSYVTSRDLYLKFLPVLTKYDPVKGIEPHRFNLRYEQKLTELKQTIATEDLRSPTTRAVIADLRQLSLEMVDENPFQVANKSGTLEKIKNNMRDRVDRESSRQAFQIFWSEAYLAEQGAAQELEFFDQKIMPLLRTNYFRGIGEDGNPIDYFWAIDIWFMGIFGLEIIVRAWAKRRQFKNMPWTEAILDRWYDLILLTPIWKWARIVPVTVRLHQTGIMDMENLRAQSSRRFVASFAEELTEVIAIQAISQAQNLVRSGELIKRIFPDDNQGRDYIDINETNEVEAIANKLIQLTIYESLPHVRIEIEALLLHFLNQAIQRSPAVETIKKVPGFSRVPQQISEQIAAEISKLAIAAPQSAYQVITAPDPIAEEIIARLVKRFSRSLRAQIQQKQTLDELQNLTADFLEELKLNYVKRLTKQDFEEILAQTRNLKQKAESDQND
ncbi:hypothetical protein Pse7367_1425 [Thalassoporum mexicanum PCC 7367]|uniref:hypothetical protein n=1 Tax=Thalassoporum mexicanum TaxID=3457544 RepID=UPI00029FF9A4|nr:hypothetical protein [Pseudanabaena sp. PCC 7367]AFY69716.1 hypothetical protein Pse7367_1425 [Pseudanabaena sp. PCC 7367]